MKRCGRLHPNNQDATGSNWNGFHQWSSCSPASKPILTCHSTLQAIFSCELTLDIAYDSRGPTCTVVKHWLWLKTCFICQADVFSFGVILYELFARQLVSSIVMEATLWSADFECFELYAYKVTKLCCSISA